MVEMEAMASRPFRAIFLELQFDSPTDPLLSGPLGGEKPPPEREKETPNTDVALLEKKEATLVDVVPKKKGKQPKTPKKGGGNGLTTDVASFPPEGHLTGGVMSNGVATQRNVCNGSIANLHPQISLQAPHNKLIKNKVSLLPFWRLGRPLTWRRPIARSIYWVD